MQSTKKSYTSTVPRAVTYAYSVSNKNTRKKNASSQTDKTVPFEEQPDLKAALKDEFAFDENTKKTYFKALDYINKIHNCMNKKLYEKYGECGDIEPEASRFFKLPNIPNYSAIYLMLLEKTRPPIITEKGCKHLKKENNKKTDFDAHKNIGKTTVIELVPDIVNLTEYNILEQNVFNENVQQVQNRSNGITRNIMPLRFETMEDTDDDYTISEEPTEFGARHTEENINYVQQVVIYSTKNGFSEEESTVENENSSASDKECGSFFEGMKNEDEEQKIILEEHEINDAVKHVKNKTQYDKQQNDRTNINDTDKNDYTEKNVIIDVIKQRVQEEFLTYLNATNLSRANNDKKARLVRSNFQGVNIQPQTNLLEYAQKKLERKHHFERETKSAESERPHKHHFNNILMSRNSVSIKPCVPEKVTNLFRKISQEKFNYDNAKHGDRGYDFQNVDTPSDNDSVILDDEEFERMSKCHYREEIKMDEITPKISSGIPDHPYEKSHPLKLNGKDMSNLNEKVLSAIGLFTERGDIRPGIIDILEEEKRAKAQDSRNKQFRARRQWDLQIHLQPKQDMNSITSVSTEKSFISLSSDIKSDFQTVKNISHQMETLKK